ncbi:hypothetical protein HSBAA_38720 [Vreelandella sulfidaeris]|uniref:Uncharacterized protein n=1 Tax=Vreelandella sulfidaeris TaxID=115553 RepID=A0A455U8S1_9GAMM|nr:hypothetical protein HSBAA_38720 [Halomonas sulfidaeris]
MSVNALYTDLSGYYDLMCLDIDYQAQSNAIRRLHQILVTAAPLTWISPVALAPRASFY